MTIIIRYIYCKFKITLIPSYISKLYQAILENNLMKMLLNLVPSDLK